MANFPKTFVDRIEILDSGIDERGDAALASLHEKGYSIGLGLTEYYAGAIGVMGYQKHIREYCPKDSTEKRFMTLPSTAEWHRKNGGRAPILLLKGKGGATRMDGYGWSGYEPTPELPDHPITTAYRLGERALGLGLSKDFTQVVVSVTNKLYAPGEGIGLETWASNHAAEMYQKVGFELITKGPENDLRPTLDPNAENGKVADQRLYMGYRAELLG